MEERRESKERRSTDSRFEKRTIPEKHNRYRKSTQYEKNIKSGNSMRSVKSISSLKDTGRSISSFCRMTVERIPRPVLIGGVIILMVLIGIVFSLGKGNGTEAAEVSAGQKDNIKGFMFIFDKRSVQQRLVEDMKKGRIPRKLTCEKINLILNDDGTVDENVDVSTTIVTEDGDFIKQVYQEMTDMIVIGQIPMRDNTTRCRITMLLQDGTECVFNFDTVSIIEIEGQDYMMESNGGLWKLLPGFF